MFSDGNKIQYHLGDSFGVQAIPGEQLHRGAMRTLVDDCQFVLVAQEHYVEIMSKISSQYKKQTNASGEVVSETEHR